MTFMQKLTVAVNTGLIVVLLYDIFCELGKK